MSLLFDVINAITGSRENPAEHNMPRDCRSVLIHVANRASKDGVYRFGLALIASDADIGIVTVRKCVAELLAHGWLEETGWSGPRNAAVRCLRPRASGQTWEPSTTMDRLSPPQRRAITGCEAGPTRGDRPEEAGPTPGDTPALHAVIGRPHAACNPGPTPRVDKPLIYPLNDPLNRPTKIIPPNSNGSLPLFGPLESDPTGTPIPASVERPTKKPAAKKTGEPTDEERRVFAGYLRGRKVRGVKLGIVPVLDAKRLKLIRERLADGYRAIDLGAAAFGVWLSDWHVEQGQARFDLALRDGEHIERFAKLTRERDEDLRRFAKTPEPAAVTDPDDADDGPPLPPEKSIEVLESFGLHGSADVIRKAHGLAPREAANG